MNNRFKFRVWDKINSKWLENCLLDVEKGYLLGYYDNKQAYNRRYVIQQCTGLTDKNCTLIYEGDIVKIFHVSGTMEGRHFIDVVEWNKARCRFDTENYGIFENITQELLAGYIAGSIGNPKDFIITYSTTHNFSLQVKQYEYADQ